MSALHSHRHVLFNASPKPLLLPPMACTSTSSLRRANNDANMCLRQTSWPSSHQSSPSSLCRRKRAQCTSSTVCHGFFGSLLGGGKTKEKQENTLEDDLGEQPEELVVVESRREDGSAAQIVYCNQGSVTAEDLEQLCTKVGWPARPLYKVRVALQNSYMVSALVLRIRKAPEGAAEAADIQGSPF
ncbi:hypothetical protein DUNSADRAFT_5997 [Dunaliella salina]|uniref:Uncharacterized protein n=1 Tax=Dunaliella salina TaxID=3046 RepID=A0ABQ7GP30_DUNSA|nr:hypothetical protein DUNSADRAFT_5997 [Dunaliella salina]|eukprot:KAF5836361.1 hypothetical protein DUNSADRAFT_5997 [Dunaliella salina]